MEHSSVANYFGYPYTTLNIHNTPREEVAAMYILASSQDMAPNQDSIYNSIITCAVRPALVIDSIPDSYCAEVAGCYINTDSLPHAWSHDNTWAQEEDAVFKNTYYKYGEYLYYDFHLATPSKARQIGLPLSSLRLQIATDLNGVSRDPEHPDAGCYSNQ